MAAHGLTPEPRHVRLGTYYDLDAEISGTEGQQHADALMALPEPPTAIFATCDILATGVLQSLYRMGRRVPQDVSVVGFDDTIAAYLAPELTTVAQPWPPWVDMVSTWPWPLSRTAKCQMKSFSKLAW